MKLCMLSLLVFVMSTGSAQSLEGSWKLLSVNVEPADDREVIKIMTDGYFALGSKRLADSSFLGAAGGEYKVKGNILTEKRDFDTYDASKINEERSYTMSWIDENTLEITDESHTKIWERLSKKEDALSGTWVITGRRREDEMKSITPGDRRTIKILGGGHFQWVAFNSATKSFMASGGGNYSAEDNIYTEYITFFSKDKDRVGDSLQFKYDIIDDQWHHKGQSSKGQPIYEIWSPYDEA